MPLQCSILPQLIRHTLSTFYAISDIAVMARAILTETTVTHVVEIIDVLLDSVLLIFSMVLYELFISKIGVAEDSKVSKNVCMSAVWIILK